MKKILVCLFALLLLLSACANGTQKPASQNAELPTLSDGTPIQLNTHKLDPEDARHDRDSSDVTPHKVDPDALKETSGPPLGTPVFSVGEITDHSRRIPVCDDMQDISLPADSVTVGKLTFSAQLQDDGATVTLLTENCSAREGKLLRPVSEFEIGFGEEITIVVTEGDTQTGYLFSLKNA